MCSPTLAITAAMSLGSMYMNQKAQEQVVDKRNSVMQGAATQSAGLQQQANQITNQTQEQFSREAQDRALQEETARRTAALQQAVQLPEGVRNNVLPTDPSAPKIIESQLGQRISDALAYGKDMAAKNAALGAYGSNQLNNNITLGKSGQQIGQLQNFNQGNTNVAGMQLDSANQAGDSSRGIADLFRVGSSAAGAYGMAGGFGGPTAPSPYALAGSSPVTTGINGARAGLGIRF